MEPAFQASTIFRPSGWYRLARIAPGPYGDAGSLIVAATGRNPVGLLFAGSSTRTIANPIQVVLTRFGVAIDPTVPGGDDGPCIRVFLAAPFLEAEKAIPKEVEGYRVEMVVTGPFRPRGSGG